MSDDAPAYINAWEKVMSVPEHNLLCNWHVDKNWRKNLKKVKGTVKQSEIYKACRVLMECLDAEKFEDLLEDFLMMSIEDPDTKAFGEYFQKYYANRPEKWAFCYRKGLRLNTNMFLEAIHKKLKYCYMEGKKNRRVDKCISYLLRFARDMMFERTIRMLKNTPTHRMEMISQSHRRSANITEAMVENTTENTWIVQSSTKGKGSYFVRVCASTECPGCPLSCPDCKVCVHQFTCTCIDHQIRGNFCKHVHACIRISKKENLAFPVNEEEVTSTFEVHVDKVVETVIQGKSVPISESVSASTQWQTLLNIASSISGNATDEDLLEEIPRIEKIIERLRQKQTARKNADTNEPHFLKLPENLPSHKNWDKQGFRSTKKKSVSHHKLSKPTEMEKVSLEAAMENPQRCSQVINTEFDHCYDSVPGKSLKNKSSKQRN